MDNMTSRPTSENIAFVINFDSVKRPCSISRDALDRLAALKNIDGTDANSQELFKAFELCICSVAGTLMKDNPTQTSLHLTAKDMDLAYQSTPRH
jgi:hypothetical protein